MGFCCGERGGTTRTELPIKLVSNAPRLCHGQAIIRLCLCVPKNQLGAAKGALVGYFIQFDTVTLFVLDHRNIVLVCRPSDWINKPK